MRIAPAPPNSLIGRFAALGGRVQGTEPTKLFLALGRHPALFACWLPFASRLMPRGRLPRRETELVILRVAHLRNCPYEFEHHQRIARRFGVTAADLSRVVAGPEAPGWTAREASVLAAVDELHADGDLTDARWASLSEHLTEPERVELVILAGHYEMLATFLIAMRIDPDLRRPSSPVRSRGAATD